MQISVAASWTAEAKVRVGSNVDAEARSQMKRSSFAARDADDAGTTKRFQESS